MLKKNKVVLWGAIVAVLLLLLLLWLTINPWKLMASPLEQTEITQNVLQVYPGEIEEITRIQDDYQMLLALNGRKYKIHSDAYSGDIHAIYLVDAGSGTTAADNVKGDASNKPSDSDQTRDNTATNHGNESQDNKTEDNKAQGNETPLDHKSLVGAILSKEEAVKLALQEIPGEEEDVELHKSEDMLYYLVEIQVKDDRLARVQLNAFSGAILSVTWENDD